MLCMYMSCVYMPVNPGRCTAPCNSFQCITIAQGDGRNIALSTVIEALHGRFASTSIDMVCVQGVHHIHVPEASAT